MRYATTDEAIRYEGYRQQLIDGDLSLTDLCQRERLRLAGDQLRYCGHWLTPAGYPRRFDTRFFICSMPGDQQTAALELADGAWVRPDDVLAAVESGRWHMVSPTLYTLKCLAQCRDVAGMLAIADVERALGRHVG